MSERRAVAIGLDGAAWHLLRPLLEQGVMPHLSELLDRSAAGTLTSTVPTYTPPAWTSAVTGVNPGRHGIYGFVVGHAQHVPPQLVHSGLVHAPALWDVIGAQAGRTGVYNVPITYPPKPIAGWMVSGMMTPGYDEHTRGFASWDRDSAAGSLEEHILRWAPGYVLDLHANYEKDWRDAALCDAALRSLAQRKTVLTELLATDPPDVLFSVLETPDRLQHVYYRYMDPADPMSTTAPDAVVDGLRRCWAAMDEIVGLLVDHAGEGGILVCSDHGFTAWETSVHVNALLARWGYLKLRSTGRLMRSAPARALVPVAKRLLPRKVAREAKGKTFTAIDWSATRAFASPIPQQGVFLNVAGRDPQGIVDPAQVSRLKDELTEHFVGLLAPDGKPATDRVLRAEDVFHGDALEGAPDLIPIMRDHRFELDDEVFHQEPFTDVSHLPRGVHHPAGIVAVAGPGIEPGRALEAAVWDVAPTLLHMAGYEVPEGLDGRVIEEAFTERWLATNPVRKTPPLSSGGTDQGSPYSAEEEAMIEESLRGLGYL